MGSKAPPSLERSLKAGMNREFSENLGHEVMEGMHSSKRRITHKIRRRGYKKLKSSRA